MKTETPIFPGYLADCFVWRADDAYYVVGTGAIEAMSGVDEARERAQKSGLELRLFTLLRSYDLVEWEDLGGALVPPDPSVGDYFSAPEVAYADGVWTMIYSAGRENQVHALRIATAERPEGPYQDIGKALTDPFACPFANDPSPFQDDDGTWYVFYARDYLPEGQFPAATGIAVDRLVDMTSLAGEERAALRPIHGWQLFDRNRVRYGQKWNWYQLEGPCVRKHDGRYYLFVCGGSWQTPGYAVDVAVADHPMGPYAEVRPADRPSVLRSREGLIGPGHPNVFVGPDGADYLVYHTWDRTMRERRMCVSLLDWTDEGPRCRVGGHRTGAFLA